MSLQIEQPTNHAGCFCFGEFRCDPDDRILYRQGEPVPLPPKAAQTLIVLLRNAPRLVEKDELLKQVWPDTFVEEGNLTHNISLLRKTLGTNGNGKGYIETVPRRGYRFAGTLQSDPPATLPEKGDAEEVCAEEPEKAPAAVDLFGRRPVRLAGTLLMLLLVLGLWRGRTDSSVQPSPVRGGTNSQAAYQEYLKGRMFSTTHDSKSLTLAVEAFQRAIQLDRGYAAAYAGLAEAYYLQGAYESSDSGYERMKSAATTALALDPNLPQPNAILGFGEGLTRWHWQEGEKRLRRALELDHSYTQAHILLAILLMRQGRTSEALQEAQGALASEPFHEVLPWLFANIYFFDHQYDQALEWTEKGMASGARFGSLPSLRALILAQQGKCTEALPSLKGSSSSRETMGTHGYILARCGERTKALDVARQLRANTDADGATTAYFLAMIDAGLQQDAAALHELEIACQGRSAFLPRIKTDPVFDRLHDEPRFRSLVSQMNLGEPQPVAQLKK